MAIVDNDLYVMAGYTGNGADGYLSDAWSLRLLDEAAACQPADFGGSERWALIGHSFDLGPLCAHCAIKETPRLGIVPARFMRVLSGDGRVQLMPWSGYG